MKKLRILCLHGYHGSARILRSQMQSLVSGSESVAEYIVIDAPSLTGGDFGWWHAVEQPFSAERGDPGVDRATGYYKGWARTREFLESVFAEQGPFDGVFGFSQGSALTGLLVGLRAPDGRVTQDKPLAFDFAVLVGGFVSNDPSHGELYSSAASFELPSLHIIGRSDFIVPNGVSRRLAAKFQKPTILEHAGGHVIASKPEIRAQYLEFLQEAARRRRA
jgi:pimeloyl-ACP methyl ester carboxylesterase